MTEKTEEVKKITMRNKELESLVQSTERQLKEKEKNLTDKLKAQEKELLTKVQQSDGQKEVHFELNKLRMELKLKDEELDRVKIDLIQTKQSLDEKVADVKRLLKKNEELVLTAETIVRSAAEREEAEGNKEEHDQLVEKLGREKEQLEKALAKRTKEKEEALANAERLQEQLKKSIAAKKAFPVLWLGIGLAASIIAVIFGWYIGKSSV